jgi:hypothetical protein
MLHGAPHQGKPKPDGDPPLLCPYIMPPDRLSRDVGLCLRDQTQAH